MDTKNTKKRNKSRDRNGENEFTLGGKRYVAKEISVCEGCVFADFPGDCDKYARPPCDSLTRKDGRNVVFVRAESSADEWLIRAVKRAVELFRENRELKRKLKKQKADGNVIYSTQRTP